MARKRLIKGANAVRVEERIARVPVDVSLPEFESGSGIFDALRAMEADRSESPAPQATAALLRMDPKPTTPSVEKAPAKPKVVKAPVEPKPKAPKVVKAPKVAKAPAERKPKVQKIKAERGGMAVKGRSPTRKPAPVSAPTAAIVPAAAPAVAVTPSPASRAAETPQKPTKPGRIGTSDFTAKERETIIRCCSDYRNHLPIYLLAVQMEVEIIDSVIDKCLASGIRPRKN